MTITLTPDELRVHEDNLIRWTREHYMVLVDRLFFDLAQERKVSPAEIVPLYAHYRNSTTPRPTLFPTFQ